MARDLVNVSDETPCVFKIHAWTMGIRLEIQRQESLTVGLNYIQEVLSLLYPIGPGSKMVRAPQESCVESSRHVIIVGWVRIFDTLCGLMNYSQNFP